MNKFFAISLFAVLSLMANASTYYGFKIGGVAVNSDNCNNVTGSNIKGSVKYDHNTKTVTLTNVTIKRTGSDNRAIYNESCDNLKVVCVGTDTLNARDAAPVRLEHATNISFYCEGSAKVVISGGSEGAIYLKNTSGDSGGHATSVTFNGGSYTVTSNGGYAIEGSGTMSSVYFSDDAKVTVQGTKGDLRHLGYVVFNGYETSNKAGRVVFRATGTGAAQFQEVAEVLKYSQSWYNLVSPQGAYFNTSSQTIAWSGGDITQQNIVFVQALPINNTNFPDAALRSALASYAQTYNGFLTLSEVNGIKMLQLNNKGLSTLQGIELFPNLEYLYCNDNNLTALDISKNPKLKIVYCINNKITSLDFSQNLELSELYCTNNEISVIVAIHDKLTKLYCGRNKINTLTLNAPLLNTLMCNNNDLKLLMSHSVPELKILDCSSNQLATFRIEDNTKLERIYCSHNRLTSLDVSAFTNLTYLDCSNNQLGFLNVSSNTALNSLFVQSNKINISMSALIDNLPSRPTWSTIYLADRDNPEEGNVVPFAKTMDARAKKWQPFYNKNDVWVEYESNPLVINATNFPDANFRNWLLAQDYGKDTYLIGEEIDTIYELSPRALDIADMTGVEHFTSLQRLNCELNNIRDRYMDMLIAQVPLTIVDGGFHLSNPNEPDYTENNYITNEQVKAAYNRGVIPFWFDGNDWIPYVYTLYERGDLNHDGQVNVGDVTALYVALLAGSDDLEYDLNGDGSVNAGDVSALYTIILGS